MKYCTNDRALRQETSHGNVEEVVVVGGGNAMDSKMQKKKTNNYDKVVQKITDLEGDLGASERTESTTVGGGTATATASTTTTTTTTTVATETATAATAAATTTSTAESTTLRALGLLSSKVQAAGAASEIRAVPGNGSLGLLDGRELDVTEALGLARLAVGGKTDRKDLTALGKGAAEIVLSGSEGQVADEKGVGSLTSRGVVEGLGLLLGARLGKVNTDGTAVNLLAGKGQSSLGTLGGGKVDVSVSN